jgi:N-acetylglucosaminyl-diphospho-decaprenol L-rhamnosyltransferase
MDQVGASAIPSEQPLALRRRQTPSRRQLSVPRLSVVIVNYCDWQGTSALARQVLRTSAARQGRAEVVVVDNHSPVDRIIPRLRRWPGVSLRRWRRNQGFARAANEGCRLSSGNWFLLLNPDVTLPPDFVDGVLRLIEELAADTGLVGFRLHNSDGSLQFSSGTLPTLAGTLAGLVVPRHRRKCRPLHALRRRAVRWVTGCCLLVRKECLQALGGFDPSFFLYYEDVDLCRRAAAAGWSVWYEPRLWAVHHRPLHARTVPAHLRLITRHALLTYAVKHWPAWQSKALGFIVRLEARLRGWWARRQGDAPAATCFAELCRITRDVENGRPRRARRGVMRAVQEAEGRAAGTG